MSKFNPKEILLSFETSPPKQRIRGKPKVVENEHSDDGVIKGRPSPVKRKVKAIKPKRRISDEFTELKPVPMWSISEIRPTTHKRDKHQYEPLVRVMPEVKPLSVQNHPIVRVMPEVKDDRTMRIMHAQQKHEEDLQYQMYQDRNDERQFELAKMRIEHAEPLARAQVLTRQQLLLEANDRFQRRIIDREHEHYLMTLSQAYRKLKKRDRLERILETFQIDNEDHDDVYISPPTEEPYFRWNTNYITSILCLGVKRMVLDETNDAIILTFIDGTRRVIVKNGQFVRHERYGTTVVFRFFMFVEMSISSKERCPCCSRCDIS